MDRARPPDDISPDEFFTQWVPEAVAGDTIRRERLSTTSATIVFDLLGDGGGVYSVRIDQGAVVGHLGDSADASLRVRVDVTTWRGLNAGQISAPEALLRRKLKLQGDFLLGLKLHLILG